MGPSARDHSRKKETRKRETTRSSKGTRRVTELVFDADARIQHLQGFSARKRERRAFGLAMQKVKDRKARLEHRQTEREARKEQVEQAEQHMEEMRRAMHHHHDPEDQEDEDAASSVEENPDGAQGGSAVLEDHVETYQDGQTQSLWGGHVVVKVSTKLPGESDDDEDDDDNEVPQQTRRHKSGAKSKDEEQEFAGRVERYLPQVKANLPGKKKHSAQQPRKVKGVHGASTMKGMASNAGDFKLAQKALQRAHGKKSKGQGGKKGRR